jgi:hypothetical protein
MNCPPTVASVQDTSDIWGIKLGGNIVGFKYFLWHLKQQHDGPRAVVGINGSNCHTVNDNSFACRQHPDHRGMQPLLQG